MPKVITDEKQIEKVLTRGVENVYPNKDLLKKLLMSGKQITLYCGYDPTAPTLHIGHGITIRKLAQFQKLGHKVIFLFGDFTAKIGDPTDKMAARKVLTDKEIAKNLKDWKKQIKNLIDIDKIEFKYNSSWLGKLKLADLLELTSYFTAQQTLARDMFQKRMAEGKELYLNELMYPIMQAYDSVIMDVDLEIGGNDQTFNMLAGRTLMKKMKNKEKFVLTTKLLADPTGKKMGKSEGNMITLVDLPADMYGKVMSWTDEMILPAFEILTDVPMEEILQMEKEMKKGANPKDFKMKLAREVVKVYLGETASKEAEENFIHVFQEGQKPAEIKEVKIDSDKLKDGRIGVLDLFVSAGLAQSNGEMRRLINERAIKIDDKLVLNEKDLIEISDDGIILQRGKKMFAKIIK